MATNNTTVETDKGKIAVKHKDESERIKKSDSDENPLPEDFRRHLEQFGKEMMKLAVDQLRDEFKQMAIEGGRQGAQMVIEGEDMAELQQDREEKERKLLELKMKNEKLENDLYSQKEKNEELKLLVAQKERQIRLLENEVNNIKKILNTPKTDLEKEEVLRKKKEDQLLSEITYLKGLCGKLKVQLQTKKSAGNVSRIEIEKLKVQIAELEGKLKEHKDQKS